MRALLFSMQNSSFKNHFLFVFRLRSRRNTRNNRIRAEKLLFLKITDSTPNLSVQTSAGDDEAGQPIGIVHGDDWREEQPITALSERGGCPFIYLFEIWS